MRPRDIASFTAVALVAAGTAAQTAPPGPERIATARRELERTLLALLPKQAG
jgi:hypothetical protein